MINFRLFILSDTGGLSSLKGLYITWVAAVNSFARDEHINIYIYIYIYIYIWKYVSLIKEILNPNYISL